MELRIDRQALVPVVQQIVDALADWLRRGEVTPGGAFALRATNRADQSAQSIQCRRGL
jgi:hypothetical protein